MNKETAKTALNVRHAIVPAEDGTDAVLGQLGLLLHRACEARHELGISAESAQEVFEMIVAAAGQQVAARSTTLKIHAKMGAILRDLMPEVASGDNGCPPQAVLEALAGTPTHLAAVAA
ncbi:MAG: hypothetical protein JOY99_16420 [Sphingomonadaceae bacterium]|nr:hypothetical protein [Sphingomonadaceae bacterium]